MTGMGPCKLGKNRRCTVNIIIWWRLPPIVSDIFVNSTFNKLKKKDRLKHGTACKVCNEFSAQRRSPERDGEVSRSSIGLNALFFGGRTPLFDFLPDYVEFYMMKVVVTLRSFRLCAISELYILRCSTHRNASCLLIAICFLYPYPFLSSS